MNLRKVIPSCFAPILLCLFLTPPLDCFCAPLSENQSPSEVSLPGPEGAELCCPSAAFDELDKKVRDGRIGRPAARAELARLLPALKEHYYEAGGRDFRPTEWVFPVEGYTAKAIGGKGRGYKAKGYDYFDGNRHKAHPSHDIFIRDRNRDQMDDASGRPVSVLSMTGGVVVAIEPSWQQGSSLRGGKYIWIYNPTDNALIYYAHNRELLVGPGDIVKPGDPIAVIGRTGLNAAKRRSPTHLHITYLGVKDGYPLPVDIYRNLAGSR